MPTINELPVPQQFEEVIERIIRSPRRPAAILKEPR
jgi:hypothetical protein